MKTIERLFNKVLTVNRRTRTDDGAGGWVESWLPNPATVRGRVCPVSGVQKVSGSQRRADVTHVFYCLAGADILEGDLLSCPTMATLEVLSSQEPSWADYHLEIDCKEVQRGY